MEFDDKFIFHGVIIFMLSEFLWEFYLSFRQQKVYEKHTQIPVELIGILPQKTFEKARVYALDKNKFHMVKDTFSLVSSIGILLVNGFQISWSFGEYVIDYFGFEGNETLQSVVCVAILNFINTIGNLPFNVYYTFVLEEKHGFNKQTVSFFIRDKIKLHILQQVIIALVICGVIQIVKIGGDYFFIYLWVFVTVMCLFLYTIYPDYIAPLFDKYTVLPEGELKVEIEKLAKSVGFPLYKLYVVEGSKRSAHSNAYFFGLFKYKRIVLFDTLLKDYSPENAKKSEKGDEKVEEKEKKGCDTMEILAVLGHELGHWKLNHILKSLLIGEANQLLVLLVFKMLFQYQPLYKAFGFFDSSPIIIGLIIVHFVCLPYFELLSFCCAILSRHFEFQADHFAKSLGRAHYLKCALIKLNSDNLEFPIYDPWYSMWHHDHPPLLERLQALDKDD